MTNSNAIQIPQLIAHRGYAAKYPENSLIAMKKAVELGVSMLEMDIQLTKDKQAVLLHDDTLERVSSSSKLIFDLSIADLKNYSLSEIDRFGSQYKTNPFATLDDMVELARDKTHLTLLVEAKQDSINHYTAKVFADVLASQLNIIKSQVIIIAYDYEFLKWMKKNEIFKIGYILSKWQDLALLSNEEIKPELVISNFKKVPHDYLGFSQSVWDWVLYEITDPKIALDFAAKGVKYIETMEVESMILDSVLKNRVCFA